MRSKLQVHIRHEIRNPRGRLLYAAPWRTANSLIKQFAQLLTAQMAQAAQNITDTGNTVRSVTGNTNAFQAFVGAGTTTYGIVIGTGTDPVTMTDYKLQTQVTAGITYGVCAVTIENPDANTWRVVIARPFTNGTGSTLNVTEVALYTILTSLWYGCMDRTLYSFSIPNGAARTVTYRITITL